MEGIKFIALIII